MTELVQEIREIAAQYPEARSAILPALHLAQKRNDGWLPPQALEEVGTALGVTPAYVQSVASFYDMLHLAPVGQHLVEVCTNICCGLEGAQGVLEVFEQELGVRAGQTTEDGEITLRAVECLGGCGWATIVAVDDHYRTHVRAEDVPAIVEELTGG